MYIYIYLIISKVFFLNFPKSSKMGAVFAGNPSFQFFFFCNSFRRDYYRKRLFTPRDPLCRRPSPAWWIAELSLNGIVHWKSGKWGRRLGGGGKQVQYPPLQSHNDTQQNKAIVGGCRLIGLLPTRSFSSCNLLRHSRSFILPYPFLSPSRGATIGTRLSGTPGTRWKKVSQEKESSVMPPTLKIG